MRKFYLGLAFSVLTASTALSATIYPLDRATILAGSPFDFKVEFETNLNVDDIEVTVNGEDYQQSFGGEADFVASELDADGNDMGSALILRNVKLPEAGDYQISVRYGNHQDEVVWDVYDAPVQGKAKNVIFLVADGLSVAHRTGARIMSHGMTEGKANGRLNMDSLERMAFIGTSATNSVATDSANTMSAYMTGHKSAVNGIGVYADRTPDTFDDPRVEVIAEAVRRATNKSIGIVSNAELQDATPAATSAHTRNRYDKAEIVDMIFQSRPDVLMGGGSAYFLPQSVLGSKRKDDTDYIAQFRNEGYQLVTSKSELDALQEGEDGKLLGLFHTGNMDTALDRHQLGKGTVEKFPDQPDLLDMTRVALDRLSQNDEGFFLMVEAALVDKRSHPMDWSRALYDMIEFDHVIGLAQEFAETHPDTLIIVTGDHTHGISIIGTIDDEKPGDDMREKVGVYQFAGFPNYEDANGDGFPDRVDVSRRLAVFSSNFPDHYETFRPKLDGPYTPAIRDENDNYIANEVYKDVPGAVLRIGNLPRDNDTAVHSVDDVVLQASGPTSEMFRGYMEQSDVYRVLAHALGLGVQDQE